jgi:hypothetical protein
VQIDDDDPENFEVVAFLHIPRSAVIRPQCGLLQMPLWVKILAGMTDPLSYG